MMKGGRSFFVFFLLKVPLGKKMVQKLAFKFCGELWSLHS